MKTQKCSNCGKVIPGNINRDTGICPFCKHTPSITSGWLYYDKNNNGTNKMCAKCWKYFPRSGIDEVKTGVSHDWICHQCLEKKR